MDWDRNQPRVRQLRQQQQHRNPFRQNQITLLWIAINFLINFFAFWVYEKVESLWAPKPKEEGFFGMLKEIFTDNSEWKKEAKFEKMMQLNWTYVHEDFELWRPFTSTFYYPILTDFKSFIMTLRVGQLLLQNFGFIGFVLGFFGVYIEVVINAVFEFLAYIIEGLLGSQRNRFFYWIGLQINLYFCSTHLETEIFNGVQRLYLKMLFLTWVLSVITCFYFNLPFLLEPMIFSVVTTCVLNDADRYNKIYLLWVAIRIAFVMKTHSFLSPTTLFMDLEARIVIISIIFGFIIGYIYREARQIVTQYRYFPGQGISLN